MKMIDLFSGIGGFHLGLEQSGFKFDWVGFSEIDKYASKQYKKRFSNAEELGDITNVRCEDLPKDIDVLCGGFPCQAFSIAGKRKGFDDTRGTLFFEIARILRYFKGIGKPIPYFILENVKGLLNHEDGRTFATIYGVLADLDYTIECQLLNTRWFLPQNRERIYIVGRFRGKSRPKIFPIGEDGKKVRKSRQVARCISSGYYKQGNQEFYLKQIGTIGEDSEATRVYDPSGCARTIKNGGGMGAKTGLYQVGELKITAKKRTYDTPPKINEYLKKYKKGTIQELAEQLKLPKTQVEHYFRADKYRAIPTPRIWLKLKEILDFDDSYDKEVTEIYEKEVEFESSRRVYSAEGDSPTLDASKKGGFIQVKTHNLQQRSPNRPSKLKGQSGGSGPLSKDDGTSYCLESHNLQAVEVKPILTPNRPEKRQNGRRFKEDGEDMFTLTSQDQHGVMQGSNIRRLTPTECERLQGFPDGWTEGQSDTQRYKQLGNAVSVPVVKIIGDKLIKCFGMDL